MAKIMIVDDEIALADMVRSLLEEAGYQVLAVSRSIEAIPQMKVFLPDLVLMDLCMPQMDGAAVAQKMKEDSVLKSVKLMFLTSLVTEEETSGLIGGYPFMAKPIKGQELLERIRREIERK